MPILTVCPHCREGKVRAPDNAAGRSATCPSCQNRFTIGASDGSVKEPVRTRVAPGFPAPKQERALPLALIAISVAGASLLISQLPYGRIGTAVGAGLGLLFGLGSLFLAEQKRLVPLLAAVLNAVVLLVVIALPGWLGWTSWRPAAVPDDSGTVKVLAHGGRVSVPVEWVDISKASWQLDDVRVSVRTVTIGPVELAGAKNQKRWTKEKSLQVLLRVTNSGVARKVEFQGWGLTPQEAAAPRLTDPTGKVLAAKTFVPGWEPAARPQSTVLFPGKSADNLLIFESPPQTSEYLRLELPATPFGAAGTVRLQIPRSSINSQ